MKTLLLLPALLAGTTLLAQAQTAIPAGTISLGGSIGYSRNMGESSYNSGAGTSTSTSTYNRFRVAPAVGLFVADNLAIGLDLGYSIGKYADTGAQRETSFRAGPYVQYYKMLSEQFGVLGTLGAGYQSSSQPGYASGTGPYTADTKGFYAGITPGIVFFPIPKFGISASIGGLSYDRVKVDIDASPVDRTESNFGASFGLDQLNFGGTFYFGR